SRARRLQRYVFIRKVGERFPREFAAHFGSHRVTARLPLLQTTGRNPSLRLSASSLRATRPNARSARATNAARLLAPSELRFLVIPRVAVEPNLYHQLPKSPIVWLAILGCPKLPNASRAAI